MAMLRLSNGTYYLITSHKTGENPNPLIAWRSTTTSLDTTNWSNLGNPTNAPNSFNSQPTFVVSYTPTSGQPYFIYMGDDWVKCPNADGSEGPLINACYIWLPIKMYGQGAGPKGMPVQIGDYRNWSLDDPFNPAGLRPAPPPPPAPPAAPGPPQPTPSDDDGSHITAAKCCVPDGAYLCTGPCFVNGALLNFTERDTLKSFGPGGVFVNNTITNLQTAFTEHEIFTALPTDCNVYTGATLQRSDVGANDQVVLEDLYFSADCAGFSKVVKGQARPGPLICKVSCQKTDSKDLALKSDDSLSSPFECAEMNSSEIFDMSFEGSWTYYRVLNPQHPMITPSMNTYGRGMWLWDSAFHVMSLASGGIGPRSLKLAGDQLRVLINAGSNIGHIPRVVGSVGLEETTQPPGILTWASLVYFNRTQDKAFLAEAYAAFVVNNRWYYTEPGYATDTGLSTWCCEDSGWDTSPRWDNGTVEAVDLNGWLHIDQLLLARMATALGKPQEAYAWKKKAFSTATAFSARLWDNSSGVFWDRLPNRTTAQNAFVKVVTPATFWSLFAGIATPAQAKAQVAASLVPGKLATAYPLPCVGVKESRFEEKNYWRGPTWINVNWLSALGFDCYGLNTEAKHIREMSAKVVGMSPYPREYYDAITGGGLGAHNYMWTGAIDIIIENELAGRTIVADVLHGVLDCPGVS